VDFIIRGEGEYKLAKLIRDMSEGYLDIHMDGLVSTRNICFTNPQWERILDLDNLPFPSYDLLSIERYFDINIPFSPVPKGDRVLPILTSRGCPFGCTFCASTNMYRNYHGRSPNNVAEEIQILVDTYSIDEVQFVDDNLLFDMERFRQIVSKLKKIGIYWCTPNGVMVDRVDENLVKEMAEAGLYQITLSVDNGLMNPKKLIRHKKVDVKRIPRLIQAAKKCGVFTHGTVVVGMLGETINDIKSTLDYVLDNFFFTSISIFIASAIPGSELYHQVISSGLVENKKDLWKTNTTSYQFHVERKEEIEFLVRDFQAKFTRKARDLDPDSYNRKYRRLIEKGLIDPNETMRLT
jgi:radical SAM superfamily enzyme YgiQ (UPF0313 family)